MCALCHIEMDGKHLCPVCLEKGKTAEKIDKLVDRRLCYDQISLLVAVLPALVSWLMAFIPTIVTAPIALFLAIRYWNAPMSIVPRTKIRFIFAIMVSLMQIGVWAMIFIT